MPVALLQPPASGGQPLPRKRFTRLEVERMLDAGLFSGQRFELIDGDLIDKMGQNPPHASAIRLCMALLMKIFGVDLVEVQLPIEAGAADCERNVPEPDLAVLAEMKRDFTHRHPNGRELALVVEVADTTLRHDALTKRDLYARAGVREYWVLDLNTRRLIVHCGLVEGKGQYLSIQSYSEDEAVAVNCVNHSAISVASLLP
jgi:Uma2 family endonuclease